jgi:hypothetical protein
MLFCWLIGALFGAVGLAAGIRFLVYFALGQGNGHVQSLVLGATAVIVAFMLFMLGFLADLTATNRRLLERIEWRLRRIELAERAGDAERTVRS